MSAVIFLSEDDAKSIMSAFDAAWGEGQGEPSFELVKSIYSVYPHVVEPYSFLPSVQKLLDWVKTDSDSMGGGE